nr:Four and a half LIM domains protein 3 [Hymenolepis microstoma]
MPESCPIMVEKCAKCHKHIEGTIVTAMNKKWHSECFVCTGCHTPLAGQSFHNKDGAPYCIKCRQEKFDPTCDKCGKKIDPTVKYSIYKDKSFHRECFTCSECNQPIDGKKFIIKDGKYCCADHLQ